MKPLFQISILISLFFISCTQSPKPVENTETTAEVFNEDAKLELDSYSKRSYEDLIEKLFNEAIKNDPNLKNLMADINSFDKKKENDLKKYDDFKNYDKSYKDAYNDILNQIKDSTLKKETQKLFDELIKQQDVKNSPLWAKETALDAKQSMLQDKVLLMKLFVTFPMMQKYWVNKNPTIKIFDKSNNAIDSLLEKTQPYTTLVK